MRATAYLTEEALRIISRHLEKHKVDPRGDRQDVRLQSRFPCLVLPFKRPLEWSDAGEFARASNRDSRPTTNIIMLSDNHSGYIKALGILMNCANLISLQNTETTLKDHPLHLVIPPF